LRKEGVTSREAAKKFQTDKNGFFLAFSIFQEGLRFAE
jgi:hypothetical protein